MLPGKDEEVKAEEEEGPVVHPNRIPGDRGVGFMPCTPEPLRGCRACSSGVTGLVAEGLQGLQLRGYRACS